MILSPILGLKKPEASDAVKRADFNFNWDILDAHTHDLATMTGVAPIAKGGTGGGDAATARANLGANDASNLTTGIMNSARLPVVPVIKGGTGAVDAASARSNIGAASTDAATTSANGLMSAADKAKLDGVATNANNYSHPNSGVGAGTYRKLTVNAQGHVTAANNDTVGVTEGGTGGIDASTARSNLGVPPTSHTDTVGAYGKASASEFGHIMLGSALPSAPGTANAGTDNGKSAREDHVHPVQTSVTGNAGTATKLQTARNINGVPFNGTADITLGTLEPIEIPESADMNDYTTTGVYFCPANATVATLSNCPTSSAFYLFVGKHAGTYQQFVEFVTTAPKVYFRNRYGSTWGAFYRQYTTADVPTSVSGNAGTATKLATARTIAITGGATASGVSFDGSGNISLSVTALDISKANAGTLPITRGGTGATDAATARTNLGITLSNLGAAASSHSHAAGDITSGTLPLTRGGTGQTTAAGVRNALGLGNTTGAVPVANGGTGQTTAAGIRNSLGLGNTTGAVPVANGGTGGADAATARSNLGAAAASHVHTASDVTSGTLPVTRGGTGQTSTAGIRNTLGLGNTTGAVPVANGGTGATSASAALTALGARRGSLWADSIAADSYKDIQVTFSPALPAAPLVAVSIMCASGANKNYAKIGAAVLSGSATTTGFTVRIFNDHSSALSPGIQWVAMIP